jgi:hypothetical protein
VPHTITPEESERIERKRERQAVGAKIASELEAEVAKEAPGEAVLTGAA